MLTSDEGVAVVLDRDGPFAPPQLLQEAGDGRTVVEGDRLAVDGDCDAQDSPLAVVAIFAAAFFSAL